LHRQLLVEVRCARAHRLLDRGNRGLAVRELRKAAEVVQPDLGYGRGLYCRALARLRREERRIEEALALAERAVSLLDDYGTAFEAGQAQVERGWVLVEAGEPDEAVPVLRMALPLVEGAPACMVVGRLGLSLALSENGEPQAARQELAEADRLIPQVIDPATRVRLLWLGAQVARRCCRVGSALRRLCRGLDGFLALGAEPEAAQVLLELLTLCLERQSPRQTMALPQVQMAFAMLSESVQLHPRARAVIGFVAYVLRDPARRRAAEVLASAGRYLVDSRYRPELPYLPAPSASIHVEWDELEPRLRLSVCKEVGAEESAADRPAGELDVALRDFLSWRFEVLARVRIVFAAPPPEPPAA
jgi:tetratricopeptide (TPR) repeat protein